MLWLLNRALNQIRAAREEKKPEVDPNQRLSRRQLIFGGFATTEDEEVEEARAPRVAIIGATPAGLRLAHLCNQNGLEFRVFDSAQEVGGGFRSDLDSFGAAIDLGFFPVLDCDAQCLELCEKLGVSLLPVDEQERFFVDSDGWLPVADLEQELKDWCSQKKDELAEFRSSFEARERHEWDALSAQQALDASPLSFRAKSLARSSLEVRFGVPCDELSAWYSLEVGALCGRARWFEYGVGALVQSLRGPLGDRIHLAHMLDLVDLEGGRYELKFSHETNEVTWVADAVIFAEFGVFRSVSFDPPMPEFKCAIFRELELGRIDIAAGVIHEDRAESSLWLAGPFQRVELSDIGYGKTLVRAWRRSVPTSVKDDFDAVLEMLGLPEVAEFGMYPALSCGYCYRVGQHFDYGGLEPYPIGRIYWTGAECFGGHENRVEGELSSSSEIFAVLQEKLFQESK